MAKKVTKSNIETKPVKVEASNISPVALIKLKNLAVETKNYELATMLRKVEKEKFKDKPQERKAKMMSLAFRMVGINVEDKTAWLLHEISKRYLENPRTFSVKTSAEILTKFHKTFNIKEKENPKPMI